MFIYSEIDNYGRYKDFIGNSCNGFESNKNEKEGSSEKINKRDINYGRQFSNSSIHHLYVINLVLVQVYAQLSYICLEVDTLMKVNTLFFFFILIHVFRLR